MKSETKAQPALIIGGGIAGPALGIALKRVGVDAVVYESTPAPRDNAGAFLNLAPNGVNALRALGLAHVVDRLGFCNDRLEFFNDAGRMLADAPVGAITVMRGELSRALREAAIRTGVQFEFDKALESVMQEGDNVVARFGDSTTATGPMLIGADGIHSRVRSSFFPNAPRPTYTGIINLGGVTHTDLPTTDTTMRMIFGRRGFFGYAVRPSGDTYWFSNFAQSEEPTRGTLEAGADFKAKLLALHHDDPPEVNRILQSVTDNIGSYAVYDILSLPQWQRGSVCLMGDAAHAVGPHVGQGASLALEDAFVLAKCLRDQPDPPTAFATFEALRRERAERVLKQSRQTGQQKAPTGWLGRKIRDLVLPLFLRKGAQAAEWMYGYPFDWETKT